MALQVSAPTRGGGVDGGLPDTTNGDDAEPPAVDTVPTTTPAAIDAPATTDTTATTAPAVTSSPATTTSPVDPAATAPAAAARATVVAPPPGAADPALVATVPSARDEVAVRGDGEGADGRGGGLRPATGGQSAGAVQSPGLLLAGLGMVVAGAAVLVVRSRRAPSEVHS
jgi:hypothetical protein